MHEAAKKNMPRKNKDREVHQKPRSNCTIISKKVEKMYGLLKGMIGQQEAPSIEMKIFDGSTLEYHQFLYFFREVLKKWIQQPQREDI